jgi:spore germination protein D
MNVKKLLLLLPIMVFLTSCSSKEPIGGGQVDYDQTKKMVVDILKTDDGKKAIQDVMSDDKMKQKLVMDQQVVTDTIQQTLTTDKATEFWKKTFNDPKFAQGVAKNMRSENEKLLKELMNDPDYRGMMIEVFKEPEIQKELADALKSKDYREHLQQVISETIESPLFKVKMQELLLKAAEDMKGKSSSKGDQGGEQSSGGQGGAGGGGAGGGGAGGGGAGGGGGS